MMDVDFAGQAMRTKVWQVFRTHGTLLQNDIFFCVNFHFNNPI